MALKWVPRDTKRWSVVDEFRAELEGSCLPQDPFPDCNSHSNLLRNHDFAWIGPSGPTTDLKPDFGRDEKVPTYYHLTLTNEFRRTPWYCLECGAYWWHNDYKAIGEWRVD